jgi:acetyl esterase/lipase
LTETPAGLESAWFHRVAVTRDIPYGDDPEQVLDVYQRGSWVGEPTFFDRSPEPRPTLVFIHGGGWVVRDRRPEPFFFTFLEHGWHVVNITYRLGPGTAPAAVDDAVCALDWVVSNAEDYGFDREKIVVAGVSAGGHLALTTGTLGSRPGHPCSPGDGFRVHSVINWLGITDIEGVHTFLEATEPEFGNYALAWIGEESRVAEISQRYSPLTLIDSESPPVLTIHGVEDSVVPYEQATALHRRLDELGVRNELLSLAGATHGGFSDQQFQQAFRAMLQFVDAD